MKKIIVVSPTVSVPVEINTNVTTWGELLPLLAQNGISTENIKGIVRETSVSLQATAAQLPTSDFTLYIFSEKNKAGCRMV